MEQLTIHSLFLHGVIYFSLISACHSLELIHNDSTTMDIRMPGVTTSKEDTYLCSSFAAPNDESYVVNFKPLATATVAHHILLYVCTHSSQPMQSPGTSFKCGAKCKGGEKIIYAWARNAPSKHLPLNVGFPVGGDTGVNWFVMQIHYAKASKEPDSSGLRLTYTRNRQKNFAGVFLLGHSSLVIPPNSPITRGDVSCNYWGTSDLYPFAFRTHAHELSRVITGFLYNGSWHLIGKADPRWPEFFYPVKSNIVIKAGDTLVARCIYNSTGRFRSTMIGSTHNDEMCNFYIMYYTKSREQAIGLSQDDCWTNSQADLVEKAPTELDTYPAPNPKFDAVARGEISAEKVFSVPNGTSSFNQMGNANEYTAVNKRNRGRFKNKGGSIRDRPYSRQRYQSTQRQASADYDFPQYSNRDSEYEYSNADYDNRPRYPYRQRILDEQPNRRPPQRLGGLNHKEYWGDKDTAVPHGRKHNRHFKNRKPRPEKPVSHQASESVTESIPHPKESPNHKEFHLDISIDPNKTWNDAVNQHNKFGQIAGVGTDSNNVVYLFHRGDHVWDGDSFDRNNLFRHEDQGPIVEPTILAFDQEGNEVARFGKNRFFMPHGLTIDNENNVWVTDVALHQVFRFSAGKHEPDLVIGKRFHPGKDLKSFCKPSDVAVTSSGNFYVADGYCNSRILMFSKDGQTVMRSWGSREPSQDQGKFNLVHSLALAEDLNLLCAADRLNARIQCFDLDGNFKFLIHKKEFGDQLYSIAYCHDHGHMFAVSSNSGGDQTFPGFLLDLNKATHKILKTFEPKLHFHQAHDVEVARDATSVYVVEIGPNKIWRFDLIQSGDSDHKTVKKAGVNYYLRGAGDSSDEVAASDKHTSVIVGTLLIVPVVVIIVMVLALKLARYTRTNNRRKRFNLGDILSTRDRSGFNRLSTEESDHEADPLTDSDVEEYSSTHVLTHSKPQKA